MELPRDFSVWIEHLRQPRAYPFAPRRVDVIETHISAIFLAGDHAYKVKKPIALEFLDFSTAALREHFCAEEVRLNAELAPGVYQRVVPVTFGPQGLAFGGAGVIVDHAVAMARLPAECMFDALLERGAIDNTMIAALAEALARFHRRAASGPEVVGYGDRPAVGKLIEDNFAQTDRLARDRHVLPRDLHDLVEAWALRALGERAELFDQRARHGCIRDGHGDLHAGNICFRDAAHGGLAIYDRIEFSAAFRCGDVAADLAFLLMDLDRRGLRGFAGMLAREWMARTGDADAAELFDFYKVYRAWVRGKIAAVRALQLEGDGATSARAQALGYFNLAAGYTVGAALVLTCGLPGTGKSHAVAALGQALDVEVLNSDTVRKQRAGLAPQESAAAAIGAGIYATAHTDATYAALAESAARGLAQGRRVVVDAGFRTRAQRAPFVALARRAGVPLVVLHLAPSDDLVAARLRARAQAGGSESDADAAVHAALRHGFERPQADEGFAVVVGHGREPLEELTAAVLGQLLRTGERDVSHAADA